LQVRGDRVDPIRDLVTVHELTATKIVNVVGVEAEQVACGSARSQEFVDHDAVMGLLLAGLAVGTGSGEQAGAFYGKGYNDDALESVSLSLTMNGADLDVHFSSMPVLILGQLLCSQV
jgi:hypothetical protein